MREKKVQILVEVIIHGLFWLGVYYALQALTASSVQVVDRYNGRPTMNTDALRVFRFIPVLLGVLMLFFYGNVFRVFPAAMRMRRKAVGLLIVCGWLLLLFGLNYVAVGFAGYLSRISHSGAHPATAPRLAPAPPPVPPDDWGHRQGIMVVVFLAMLGISVAYFFIKEWIRNDLRRSQAEAQQLDTEIRFLRSQVNPHFLFNTLNNLFSMAQGKGHEELADSISKLSDMMRYMLYESNTETVSLQREIAYLQDCIALNKLRYADSEVAVSFCYPSAAASVAPMLFVPFLENAFKHGVVIGRQSRIDVDVFLDGKNLRFTCVNTDHSSVRKLEQGGIGLENVRRRLELVYPGRHRLEAGIAEGKYIVNLQIELS